MILEIVEISKASSSLACYAKKRKKETIALTEGGKTMAAFASVTNGDFETLSLSNNLRYLSLTAKSSGRLRSEGGISSGEKRKRLGPSK